MRRFHPLLRQATLDPFQILDVSRSASKSEIKQAYFALVKKHHPDRPSSSKPKDFEFKDIVAAYELLQDPVKRHQFTTYGMGWGDKPSAPRMDMGFNYDNVHNPWKRRGDTQSRYQHAYQRPRYPSSNWDYGHSDSTSFYSTNWQAEQSSNTSGMYTSNAAFISVLAGLSALLYSLSFAQIAIPVSESSPNASTSNSFPHNLLGGDPKDAPIYRHSPLMKGRDRHHEEASQALGAARQNAQKYGISRREGIRRRVRENALEAVEAGKTGTGHVGLDQIDHQAGTTNSQGNNKPDDGTPERYERQVVPPSQRSLRKPAYREHSVDKTQEATSVTTS